MCGGDCPDDRCREPRLRATVVDMDIPYATPALHAELSDRFDAVLARRRRIKRERRRR
jgi:hypothetical protein